MRISGIFRWLMLATLVLGLSGTCLASVQDEYTRGVKAFKSLLEDEKMAGFRAEWLAVMKPFERSLAADPKGEFAPRAMYFLGRSHEELARRSFNRSDRKNALDAFDRMLASFPNHGWADDSLYRKGMIYLEQAKDMARAEEVFRAVIATYPKGDMAPEARKRLEAMGKGADSVAAKTATESKTPPPSTAAPAVASGGQKTAAKPAVAPSVTLMGIRHWSSDEYTRVVMDMTGDVAYERALVEKTSNGNKQLQITLQKSGIDSGVMATRSIQDGILSHIYVDADGQGNVLVNIDLMQMDHYRVFTLPEPYRVVLDIYGAKGGKVASAAARPAAPEQAPQQTSQQAAGPDDKEHVQAALAELQARKDAEVVKKESPAKAESPKKQESAPAKTPPATKPAAVAPAQTPPKTPEIAVTPKQKKYAGSLVEQLGLKVRTIMIDPGHGGKDPGAVANGVREKDINLRMAKILGKMLSAQGFEVHYTRTTDKFIPLEERTAMANAKNADLFISLHCNAYKDASAKGLEVYYLNLATDAQAVRVAARENGVSAKKISDMQFILSDLMLNSKINESRQMAALVEKETLRVMRPKYQLASHGSKGAFFYVLTGARMPSVLVELGYLTNPAEAAKLNSDEYLTAMAKGLTAGIVAYKDKLEKFSLNSSGKS